MREHILSNDGEVLESLTDSAISATPHLSRLFLVVPHSHPFSDIPSVKHLDSPPGVVTDLWAERCLQSKQLFEPDDHILSRPIQVFPIPGFENLVINSTGVADIDLLHVSKIVVLLGAKYDQVLKTGISVLLCNPGKAGGEKLRHAREWHIPAVSIEWLWTCIRRGILQPFRAFLLKDGHKSEQIISDRNATAAAARPQTTWTTARGVAEHGQQVKQVCPSMSPVCREALPQNGDSHAASKTPKPKLLPGEGFVKSPQPNKDRSRTRSKKHAPLNLAAAASKHEAHDKGVNDNEGDGICLPLQEISTNSPPKSEKAASPRRRYLTGHGDGESSLPDHKQDDETPSAPEATATGKTTYLPPRAESIHGAIKELLNRSKAKNTTPTTSNGENKKKRLLGRALSNMSNSSREGNNVRASRASSIDSANTDGLGSVILDEMSESRRNSSGAVRRGSFTGRASAQERGVNGTSWDLGDAALYREEYVEEEAAPQMTQLGYDNPDEAVALREMLAERRRNRTRRGQEDVKPPDTKEGKKIKDDVKVMPAGWGAGRRTRQKARSP